MDTTIRGAEPPLERLLFDEGYRFEFFQAVRLLERLQPDRSAVGEDSRNEVARFSARLSLAFPPSQIHSVEPLGR